MALSSALPVFPLGIETGPGLVPSRQGANLRLDLERTALPTTGSGNDYRVDTGGRVKEVRGGLELLIEADRTNTGPAYLVVDRFTRYPMLDAGGAPQAANRIVQGRFYSVLFSDADQAFRVQAGASTLDEIPGLIDLRQEVASNTATTVARANTVAQQAGEVETARAQVAGNTQTVSTAATNVAQDRVAVETARTAALNASAQAQAAVAGGRVTEDTLAQLQANLTPGDGAQGEVLFGPEAGLYRKVGASGSGSWTLKSRATVSGLQLTQDFQAGNVDTEVPGAPPPPRFNFDATTGRAVLMDPNVTLLFPQSGQSLDEGVQPTGPDPLSTTALYPGRVLMPSTGARFYDAFKEGSAALLDYGYFDELVSARETRDASGLSESPVSGFGNHFYKLMEDAFPGAPKCRVASFVSAKGGTQLRGLKEGSAAFRQLLRGVQCSVDAEARKGRRVIVPGIIWIQGEADVNNPAYSELMLELLRRAYSSAIKAITGQTQEVMLFLAQTNTVNSGIPAIYQRVQLRQLLAAQRYPHIRLVGPLYPWPMEQSSNATSSAVHKSSVGTNRIGMMFARGVFAEICGTGCVPFAPTNAFMVNSNLMQVEFDVPVAPIVMDTSGTTISTDGINGPDNGVGYFGFEVFLGGYPPAPGAIDYASRSIAITGHNVFAPTILRLQLASTPTTRNVWLAYAWRRNVPDAGTADGPVTGARGCLRDSAAHVSLMDGVANQNWCNTFCIPVNAY